MPAAISTRWKPGHVIRMDTEAGTYEEVNPPLITQSESGVQRAMIATKRRDPDVFVLRWSVLALLALGTIIARWG